MKLGTATTSKFYVGATAVSKVCLGSTMVWTGSDTVPPLLTYAATNTNGDELYLTFDEPVTFGVDGELFLSGSSSGYNMAYYGYPIDANIVAYYPSSLAQYGEDLYLDWSSLSPFSITDAAGNLWEAITNFPVTNNVVSLAPILLSATVIGDWVTLVFDRDVGINLTYWGLYVYGPVSGTIAGGYIGGVGPEMYFMLTSPVTAGDPLDVSYEQPGDGIWDSFTMVYLPTFYYFPATNDTV